jgi:hypothetical protein
MNGYPASPTIESVLNEFLEDQQQRLKPRTFLQYDTVIDLLRWSLERSTIPADPKVAEAVDKARQEGQEDAVCSLCDPDEIASGMPEFLGWFMVRHVAASPSLMRQANTVTRKLTQWLAEHHYLDASSQEVLAESVGRTGPLLPKVAAMRDHLADWISQRSSAYPAGAVVTEGHFTVEEVTAKGWKIYDIMSDVHGEIPVPPQWLDPEQVGWEVSGAVASLGTQLKWVEIWNIYP